MLTLIDTWILEGMCVANSPYAGLPSERFWRTGVTEQHPLSITSLYKKRFDITRTDRIATAGSCFAQHIARNLRQRGCNVLDLEPAPPGLSLAQAQERGFALYSARYGNIYTASQLLQLLREALGEAVPAERVWEKEGRFYDAQRPQVEPGGHASPELVIAHRNEHLQQVRRLIEQTDVFVFTFGLTEGWIHKPSGTVFPTAPGTIAGSYDPAVYAFKNYTVAEILSDFEHARRILREKNPGMRFLVTVSPVPLTATASQMHVLQATTLSKSILRAVCGEIYDRHGDVDYFPSYELISSPFSRGFFFESNLRSVSRGGVESVMRVFFEEHAQLQAAPAAQGVHPEQDASAHKAAKRARRLAAASAPARTGDDVVCEEAMLEAFAK